MNKNSITDQDRKILRDLAKKQYEYSQMPQMLDLTEQWYKHNDLKGSKPMVTIEFWTFLQEMPKEFKCTTETGRSIEFSFLNLFSNYELIGDDKIIPPFYPVSINTWFRPFDIPIEVKRIDGSLGHEFIKKINDLEVDYPSLKKSAFGTTNQEELNEWKEFLEDVFGDILPVEYIGNALYSVPTQDIVHVMGMENMLFSMYDYPETFHKLMDKITDDYIEYFKWRQDQKLLLPTTSIGSLGQGSYCYTRELPSNNPNGIVTIKDKWGFMDSQETTGISPAMFNEFIFPYYKKISDMYGLFSYGCCEAVDSIYDLSLSKCDNLRKLSISPWCNEEMMGERLANSNTIFHRKPSPNYLGVGKEFDEAGWRMHILKTLKAAKGCKLEITQRDVYTLSGNIDKLRRSVEIARELIEDNWE